MSLQRATPRRTRRAAGRTVPALVAAAVAGSVLLSGCGVTGTDWRPGLAAEVGDDSLSSDEVDEYTGYFCDALDEGTFGQVAALPRGSLRQGVAGNLSLRLAADQLADDYGVTPGDYYQQVRSQAAESVSDLPDDARGPLVDVQSAPIYVSEVSLAVGRELLDREGGDSTDPDAAAARGQEALLAWLDDHEVDFNPSLNIRLTEDGGWEPAGGSDATSVAVSDIATAGADDGVDDAGQPTPEYTAYVADLPASHRCGGS